MTRKSRSMPCYANLQATARTGTRRLRWPEGCGAYFPDLEPPMHPPDLPKAPLRVIRGGKRK
jgi:hypothetical protein